MAIKFINEELKKLLGDDLYAKLDAALKDQDVAIELSKNFLPIDRVHGIESQRDEHKGRADKLQKDFDELVKSLGATNADEFKTKYTGLTDAHKKELQDAEKRYQDRERDYVIDDVFKGAKAKNLKAARALIDPSKVVIKDGKITEGLDIEALKKSDPYLFGEEQAVKLDAFGKPIVQNGNPGAGGGLSEAEAIAVSMGIAPESFNKK